MMETAAAALFVITARWPSRPTAYLLPPATRVALDVGCSAAVIRTGLECASLTISTALYFLNDEYFE